MANVFNKLIRREFGDVSYKYYFGYYRKNIYNQKVDNEIIFNDMYQKLMGMDAGIVEDKQRRLNDALLDSLDINRHYAFTFFAYIFASFFIIAEGLLPIVTAAALVIMSLCFIYKSHEFIANKFCYIDARIILVYKSAIEAALMSKGRRMPEE